MGSGGPACASAEGGHHCYDFNFVSAGRRRRATLTTVAVSPAAEEDLPDVYTARGRNPATYFSSWLLAQDGSPTMATLMSPRRLMPCGQMECDRKSLVI